MLSLEFPGCKMSTQLSWKWVYDIGSEIQTLAMLILRICLVSVLYVSLSLILHITDFFKRPWRREWLPTPEFWPGEFHGQRNLAGYSPWGSQQVDMTEWLSLTHSDYHSNMYLLLVMGHLKEAPVWINTNSKIVGPVSIMGFYYILFPLQNSWKLMRLFI